MLGFEPRLEVCKASALELYYLSGPSESLTPPLCLPLSGRYTYEIAPVFVLMEEEVLRKLRALVGWSSGDGVFCPGA